MIISAWLGCLGCCLLTLLFTCYLHGKSTCALINLPVSLCHAWYCKYLTICMWSDVVMICIYRSIASENCASPIKGWAIPPLSILYYQLFILDTSQSLECIPTQWPVLLLHVCLYNYTICIYRYINGVKPGKYGVRKPFYFPCLPSYWIGKRPKTKEVIE